MQDDINVILILCREALMVFLEGDGNFYLQLNCLNIIKVLKNSIFYSNLTVIDMKNSYKPFHKFKRQSF